MTKIKNNSKTNKRGQIASTMTWMTAFIIMILFITSVIIFSGTKKIPVVGSGGNQIEVEKYAAGGYALQRQLNNFIVSGISYNNAKSAVLDFLLNMKSLEGEEAKVLKDFTLSYFNTISSQCHVVCVSYYKNNELDNALFMNTKKCPGNDKNSLGTSVVSKYECKYLEDTYSKENILYTSFTKDNLKVSLFEGAANG